MIATGPKLEFRKMTRLRHDQVRLQSVTVQRFRISLPLGLRQHRKGDCRTCRTREARVRVEAGAPLLGSGAARQSSSNSSRSEPLELSVGLDPAEARKPHTLGWGKGRPQSVNNV
jgi:hypothetical protein